MKLPYFLVAAIATVAVMSCSTKSSVKEFSYSPVPEDYKVSCEKAGTLERVEYSVPDKDGDMADKSAYVYVPYGYDSSKKYEIIYIMHGGAANNTTYLGTNEEPKEMKHMFDHMIASGEIPPVLLVTPTIFNDAKDRSGNSSDYIEHFQKELRDVLIPLVEGKYSTFAKSTSEKDLVASRDHRYFTGFSMGGSTTWSVFSNNMKYFRTFIPCSGDSWKIAPLGGSKATAETVDALIDAVSSQGYSSKDFFIFSLTGKTDMAAANLVPQIENMRTRTDFFSEGLDLKKNNLFFFLLDGGEHNAAYFANYLHSALPTILN